MFRTRIAALVLAAGLLAAAPAARAAGLAVDLKSDENRSVSVPVGTDNGVTAESDFAVAVDAGRKIPIFPAELYPKRFWSAPLSIEDYEAVKPKMAVERYDPGPDDRQRIRRIAAENARQIRQQKASAERIAQRKELDALRDKRAGLVERRERIEGWIAEAEGDLAGEQARMEWSNDGIDADIDRIRQRIDEMTDQRNELQARRDALPRENRGDHGRLTTEIDRLNARIASERSSINSLRERQRSNQASLSRETRDKKKLEAEARSIDAEIRALDFKIRELASKLGD